MGWSVAKTTRHQDPSHHLLGQRLDEELRGERDNLPSSAPDAHIVTLNSPSSVLICTCFCSHLRLDPLIGPPPRNLFDRTASLLLLLMLVLFPLATFLDPLFTAVLANVYERRWPIQRSQLTISWRSFSTIVVVGHDRRCFNHHLGSRGWKVRNVIFIRVGSGPVGSDQMIIIRI